MATQRSKFLQWIDFRVRLTLQDGTNDGWNFSGI
jgi:hypothetical protein